MAGDKLSAREAALIAQARAELANGSPAQAGAQAPAAIARGKHALPAAAVDRAADSADTGTSTDRGRAAPPQTAAAAMPDAAERLAALMAAARAETELLRRRWRRLYLWTPAALLAAISLWMLLLIWYGR